MGLDRGRPYFASIIYESGEEMAFNKFKKSFPGFYPGTVPCWVAAIIFCSMAILTVATDFGQRIPAALHYAIYACAAISLALAIWMFILAVREKPLRQRLRLWAQRTRFTSRLMEDVAYRTVVLTHLTLAMNILLALAKAAAGWYFASAWLMSLADYYIILCIARFLLLRNHRKLDALADERERRLHELRAYRLSGALLIVMTAALQGIVIMIVRDGRGFSYSGMIIYAVALYDFYCLFRSIRYMVRMRKKHNPILVSMKTFSLASALVAMLSLQTAMFASFGHEMQLNTRQLMNTLTGLSVCIILLAFGIFMVTNASRQLRCV